MKEIRLAVMILLAGAALGLGLRFGFGNETVVSDWNDRAFGFVERHWLTSEFRRCWKPGPSGMKCTDWLSPEVVTR